MAFIPAINKSNLESFIEQVIQTSDFVTIDCYDSDKIVMTTHNFSIAISLLNSLTDFCAHPSCFYVGKDDKNRRVWELEGYF